MLSTARANPVLRGIRMSKVAKQKDVLNEAEAAKYVGVARMSFRKHFLLVEPPVPYRRVGRRILVSRAALDRWLEGHDVQEDA